MLSELDEKRVSVSISLAESEKKEIKNMANEYGLSLSAFLRLAAKEFATRHAKTSNTGN
ncbi:MAG: ribbon-helix-helix protein, CopG family [Rothia mucilaginosa]|jgi:ribbon-helix-helix protein, copG family|nr:ribbon-helix-helix protein, CopG family [Rothia mucilaginosa]